VNIAAPVVWMLFGAWMLAISYVDYPMGNHGLGFPEQRRRLRERRYLALGFGGAVMCALAVPVVNFLVIPAAVAGATALWVERLGAPRPPPGR
jgi:CysZ protein